MSWEQIVQPVNDITGQMCECEYGIASVETAHNGASLKRPKMGPV